MFDIYHKSAEHICNLVYSVETSLGKKKKKSKEETVPNMHKNIG